jgi:hypothetical protein
MSSDLGALGAGEHHAERHGALMRLRRGPKRGGFLWVLREITAALAPRWGNFKFLAEGPQARLGPPAPRLLHPTRLGEIHPGVTGTPAAEPHKRCALPSCLPASASSWLGGAAMTGYDVALAAPPFRKLPTTVLASPAP